MKYVFDLRCNPLESTQFLFYPNAVVALRIPERLDDTLSLLVWGGIIVNPLQHPGFADLLQESIRSRMPAPVYHSGWGVITYHQVCGGKVIVRPFAPRLSPGPWEQLSDQKGQPISFQREWPVSAVVGSTEWDFEFLLEQPWAYMYLSISVAGPIHFAINPERCVTNPQESPDGKDAYDLYRSDQLIEMKSILYCDH